MIAVSMVSMTTKMITPTGNIKVARHRRDQQTEMGGPDARINYDAQRESAPTPGHWQPHSWRRSTSVGSHGHITMQPPCILHR